MKPGRPCRLYASQTALVIWLAASVSTTAVGAFVPSAGAPGGPNSEPLKAGSWPGTAVLPQARARPPAGTNSVQRKV